MNEWMIPICTAVIAGAILFAMQRVVGRIDKQFDKIDQRLDQMQKEITDIKLEIREIRTELKFIKDYFIPSHLKKSIGE